MDKGTANQVALASIGALFFEMDKLISSNNMQEVLKRADYARKMCMFLGISMFLSFIYVIWLRRYLLKMAVEMDQDNLTPSDFCIMGTNIKMDKHDSQHIQDTLKEKLES